MLISTTRPKYDPLPFPVQLNWYYQAVELKKTIKLNYYDLTFINRIIDSYDNSIDIVWSDYEYLSYLFDTYIGNKPIIN